MVLRGRYRGKVPLSSHHIKGTINMTYQCWHWPWSPGWGSVCQVSPLWNYSISPRPLTLFSLEGSHYVQQRLKSGELYPTSFRVKCFHKLLRIFFAWKTVSSSLLSKPLIYQFSLVDIFLYFVPHANTILFIVAQIVPTLDIGNSADSCVPLTYPHYFVCAYLFTYLPGGLFPYFWHCKMFQANLVYFLPRV